jgi:8-amino-7-oxononanoate synthase
MLRENILHFNREITQLGIKQLFVKGKSAIQSAIIPGNETVKKVAVELQRSGYDVRPILSPTVPAGQERLRFCLHSFNSRAEISDVLRLLATFVYG